ncbi:MAG TPA: Gfo/Idh/MocA family oxidoreductase [Mycobacteriales bacterium]|nr:Gfo/Idh/MocA family oxidoreductase [Mycobacteriales bacterium]
MKVAIVGFGTAGAARVSAYQAIPEAELCAVVDPVAARRECAVEEFGLPAFASLSELVGKVDAVDICSPPAFHLELSLAALNAGMHVICEKPVAFRSGAADALVEASRRNGRLLYPAHNYGFSPMMRLLSGAIGDGRIGSPMTATFQIGRDSHARGITGWQPDWRRDPDLACGGILLDHGTHCVYMATRLFGAVPAKVSCVAEWSSPTVDEAVEVHLDFPGGACDIQLSWISEGRTNLYQCSGPHGSISVRNGTAILESEGTTTEQELSSPTGSSTHEEWFAAIFADFRGRIGDESTWDGPLGEMAATARILEAAYQSARMSGQPVALATP